MKNRLLFLVSGMSLTALFNAFGQPIITRQPTNQSVGLGAFVSFRVTATSTKPPLGFECPFVKAQDEIYPERHIS